ncbi:hypothetical protein PUN28_002913 [Cardiocondyla obscurior]|uniref:Uncharacterized protein n=1 Tax=Cardiocondyla obscurior TaxID=286306 RepID=A0AAW2GX03_9HYME
MAIVDRRSFINLRTRSDSPARSLARTIPGHKARCTCARACGLDKKFTKNQPFRTRAAPLTGLITNVDKTPTPAVAIKTTGRFMALCSKIYRFNLQMFTVRERATDEIAYCLKMVLEIEFPLKMV